MKDLHKRRDRAAVRGVIVCLVLLMSGPMNGTAGGNGSTVLCPYLPPGIEVVPECGGERATCVGTGGDDLIVGTAGKDVIVGGAGADVILGYAGADVICGGLGNDSIMGGSGKDVLFGDEGCDWLFGAQGSDVLHGGAGDFDVLWGGPGFDFLDGGEGEHDVCMLQKDLGEADAKTCDTIYPIPGYPDDAEHQAGVYRPDEALGVSYRPAATIIVCPWIPNEMAATLECGGRKVTCVGTDGNDLIYGTSEDDVIWAGAGDDVAHGDTGNDIICGGSGMDSLMGAGGNDTLFGEDGDDRLYGATGNDALFGGAGDRDVLWAGSGEDRLDGGAGSSDLCLLEGCTKLDSASGYGDPSTCEVVYPPSQVDGM